MRVQIGIGKRPERSDRCRECRIARGSVDAPTIYSAAPGTSPECLGATAPGPRTAKRFPVNLESFFDALSRNDSIPCSRTVILIRALYLLSRRPMACCRPAGWIRHTAAGRIPAESRGSSGRLPAYVRGRHRRRLSYPISTGRHCGSMRIPMSWARVTARSTGEPLTAILNLRGRNANSGWSVDHCRSKLRGRAGIKRFRRRPHPQNGPR